MDQGDRIRNAILKLAAARGPEKTICPSEAARHVAAEDRTEWRPLMAAVRTEAIRLADSGRIDIKKGGATVDAQAFTGIYRIAIRAE